MNMMKYIKKSLSVSDAPMAIAEPGKLKTIPHIPGVECHPGHPGECSMVANEADNAAATIRVHKAILK